MALDFRDQYFGCEIEMTGLTRQQAARTLAELFGTSITHYGGTYDGYRVTDREGKDWKIVSDGSIHAFRRSNGRQVPAGREYRVEMNSPKLEYAEMEKLQEVVRALRHAGAFVNDSCGMHVHIDAARHTPKSLKNLLSIMYSKEDILFAALKVDESRTRRWCRRVEEPVLQTIRKLPKDASMEIAAYNLSGSSGLGGKLPAASHTWTGGVALPKGYYLNTQHLTPIQAEAIRRNLDVVSPQDRAIFQSILNDFAWPV